MQKDFRVFTFLVKEDLKEKSFHLSVLLTILLCVLFINLQGNAQDLEWAQAKPYSNVFAVTTDAQGNSYTAGAFQGTQDFDPGPGTMNITALGTDGFVIKEDPSGNLLWVARFGGTGAVVNVYDIGVDLSNNVFITGRFEGTVDFNPGSGTNNLVAAGSQDAFIGKLNNAGNYVWAYRFGASGVNAIGHGLAVDDASNVYITGTVYGIVDFNPAAATNNLGNSGTVNAFLCKYTSTGAFSWGRSFGGSAMAFGSDLALDNQNNVFTAGNFNGYSNFDPGFSNTYLWATDNQQIYLTKHSSSGTFQWVEQLAGYPFEWGENMTIDASNNVYVSAPFSNSPDFDPGAGVYTVSSHGNYDSGITKLDNDGNLMWAKQIGSPGNEFIANLHTDTLNNVFVTGVMSDSVFFGEALPENVLYSSNQYDVYLSKLDSMGTIRWMRSYGGPNLEQSNTITIDPSQDLYIGGYFNATADFDPGPGIFELSSPPADASGFLQKINLCAPVFENDSITSCGPYSWINGVTYHADPGPVTFTLTDASGCDVVKTLVLNILLVHTDISMPDAVSLEALNSSADNYQWVNCENSFEAIAGATSQLFQPSTNGSYAVIVSQFGCSDTSVCLSVSSIGLAEIGLPEIQLIPNPASESIHVISSGKVNSLEIINIQGSSVLSLEVNVPNLTLDLSTLIPGVYFMRLRTDSGQRTLRFIKE